MPNMNMDLKSSCTLRPYQEKSLRKMFGNGRARSGIIVLPCGAGKTLTGVAAACTIKKRTLVLCTSSNQLADLALNCIDELDVAVDQWRNEFLRWSNLDPKYVVRFTRESKDYPVDNCIIVATYAGTF